MKLRNLAPGSTLRVSTPAGPQLAVFDHLDGSYSHCHVAGNPGEVFHLYHGTAVNPVDDGTYVVQDDRSN
jgi:hypothetical protein